MTEVRTRDDAIALLSRGVATWATSVSGVWTQATAATSATVDRIDREVRCRRQELAAARAAASERNRGNRAAIAKAEASLTNARKALALAQDAHDTVLACRRRLQRTIENDIAGFRSNLMGKGDTIERYRAGGAVGGAASAKPRSGNLGLGDANGPKDIDNVDIDEMDYSDNPIVGEFGKGGATRSDYLWATETWSDVVSPGLSRGKTREDFAKRDAERNAPALRRTADVLDLFTGDSSIVLSRRSDGSLDVINGRHRIEAAKELGIPSLPARIIE